MTRRAKGGLPEAPGSSQSTGGREWPLVSVSILAFNRRDPLRVTLHKILGELEYPQDRLEVIVVDNASTDGTDGMLAAEFPSVKVLSLASNVGISGFNAAIPHAQGDWLLMLDDDCYLEADALKRSIEAAWATEAQMVSYRIGSSERARFYFNDLYHTGLLSFWGCAVLIEASVLRQLGGYDPAIFLWGNELELSVRFLDAGFRHLYLDDVVAIHMTPLVDSPAFSSRMHALNYRHFAYVAVKLLRPLDASIVLGRLLLVLSIDAATVSPAAVTKTLPQLAEAVVSALRARVAVRSEVSAAYRGNFISFANPLSFVRRPSERVRMRFHRGGPVDRGAAFRRARPRFFPSSTATLDL